MKAYRISIGIFVLFVVFIVSPTSVVLAQNKVAKSGESLPYANIILKGTNRGTTTNQIKSRDVSYYGRHFAKVYCINQEYADLYIFRLQDTRDLNEPLSNIENGLGVFNAFNSSNSIYFYFRGE